MSDPLTPPVVETSVPSPAAPESPPASAEMAAPPEVADLTILALKPVPVAEARIAASESAPASTAEPVFTAAREPVPPMAPPVPPTLSAQPEPKASRWSTLLAGFRARSAAAMETVSVFGVRRGAAYGACVAAALALGWGGASLLAPSVAKPDPTIAWAAQTEARLARLGDEIKLLRDSMAAMAKGTRPRSTDDLKPVQERLAGLSESLDKLRQDQGGRAAPILAAVDRVEKLDREAIQKIALMSDRLDRIERQTAGLSAGSAPATAPVAAAPAPVAASPQTATPAPQTAAAIPAPPARAADRPGLTAIEKPPVRSIAGWALRDTYDGVALIESRQYGMMEVAPGQTVRGLGRIEKLERRAGRWVLVTEQGPIVAN